MLTYFVAPRVKKDNNDCPFTEHIGAGPSVRLTNAEGREAVLQYRPRFIADDLLTLQRAVLAGMRVVVVGTTETGDVVVVLGAEPAASEAALEYQSTGTVLLQVVLPVGWDSDEVAWFDIGNRRILIARADPAPEGYCACLTVAAGPAPYDRFARGEACIAASAASPSAASRTTAWLATQARVNACTNHCTQSVASIASASGATPRKRCTWFSAS